MLVKCRGREELSISDNVQWMVDGAAACPCCCCPAVLCHVTQHPDGIRVLCFYPHIKRGGDQVGVIQPWLLHRLPNGTAS